MVQPGIPRAAGDRLADPGRDPREADRVRSGPRDPGLGRSPPATRARPPLLRLLPSEPAGRTLIFVEIALVHGLATHIEAVIDAPVPNEDLADPEGTHPADTAIFYSITNCQTGLRGIPLGDFLLKQVTDELQRTVPSLRQFSTLSPYRDCAGGSTMKGSTSTRAPTASDDSPPSTCCTPNAATSLRFGRPIPPAQRRSTRADQCRWRSITQGRGRVVRRLGQLSVRPRPTRRKPRGVHQRVPGRPRPAVGALLDDERPNPADS